MRFLTGIKFISTILILILCIERTYGAPSNVQKSKDDKKSARSPGALDKQNNQSRSSRRQNENNNLQENPVNSKSKQSEKNTLTPQSNQSSRASTAQSKPNNAQASQTSSSNTPSDQISSKDLSRQQIITFDTDFSYSHIVNSKEGERKKESGKRGKPKNVLFLCYSYPVDWKNEPKLEQSKNITKFLFSGKIPLEFDNLAKLPDFNTCSYITIFACSHNQPLILRLKIAENGKFYHYYYVMDSTTKKFRNTGIQSLEEPQEIDTKGLTRHIAPVVSITKSFFEKIAQEWEQVFEGICQVHGTVFLNASNKHPIGISFVASEEQSKKDNASKEKSPKNGNAKQQTKNIECVFNFTKTRKTDNKEVKEDEERNGADLYNKITLFKYYSYDVDKQSRGKVANSKAVMRFTFNYEKLKFDDLSKLPDHKCWDFIRVFTCQHGYPVMLRFKTTENDKGYHYYYVLDAESMRFKNTGIPSLDERPETDAKGLTRHIAPENTTSEEFSKKIEEVWLELFEGICQGHKRLADISNTPFFELVIIPSKKVKSKNE